MKWTHDECFHRSMLDNILIAIEWNGRMRRATETETENWATARVACFRLKIKKPNDVTWLFLRLFRNRCFHRISDQLGRNWNGRNVCVYCVRSNLHNEYTFRSIRALAFGFWYLGLLLLFAFITLIAFSRCGAAQMCNVNLENHSLKIIKSSNALATFSNIPHH